MPAGARDVYFSVRSFAEYGKLSRRNVDDLEVGARVAKDETKRDPLDFALWKGCGDDELGLAEPLGQRAARLAHRVLGDERYALGHGFDIHGGGMDLDLSAPRKRDRPERSSVARVKGPFAHLWMHNGFLNIDKEKMSKSIGNVVKPRDIYRRNDPEALRYVFLTAHYRGPLAFDIEHDEAGAATFPGRRRGRTERRLPLRDARAHRAVRRSAEPDERRKSSPATASSIEKSAGRVLAALDDDLNTPVALAQLGELAKATNELCDMLQKRRKDAALVQEGERLARKAGEALMKEPRSWACSHTTCRLPRAHQSAPPGIARALRERIEAKLEERAAARQNKDFAGATSFGPSSRALVDVFDSPAGSTCSVRV